MSEAIRTRAATFALAMTIFLTGAKLVVAQITGSVSMLSEGIHSSLDFISAGIAFYGIRAAGKPADRDHPFGHGKFETLSSLVEALLLVAAAAFIAYEAWDHFKQPKPLVHENLAIGTIVLGTIFPFGAYLHNIQAANKTGSNAIRLNALHFLTDAITSVGVLVALVAIKFTGLTWIDPLASALIAIYVLSLAVPQIRRALGELADEGLPENEVKQITEALKPFQTLGATQVHDLRTRRSGVSRHVEFHVLVPGSMTVAESHSICDAMEAAIHAIYPNTLVTIHVEPKDTHHPVELK